jgi:hypothetical protein
MSVRINISFAFGICNVNFMVKMKKKSNLYQNYLNLIHFIINIVNVNIYYTLYVGVCLSINCSK